jgi:hypothetical protein
MCTLDVGRLAAKVITGGQPTMSGCFKHEGRLAVRSRQGRFFGNLQGAMNSRRIVIAP